MKWIAALLMVFNVLVFLGVSDRQVEFVADQQELRPDVNRDSMLLLKEVYPQAQSVAETERTFGAEDGIVAPSISSAEDLPVTELVRDPFASLLDDTDEQETAVANTQSMSTEIAALTPAEIGDGPADLSCYRVGPFKNKSIWAQANSWVQAQNIKYEAVRSESRELRAVRVYVGPFESIAAAQADVDILKQKELDYFVYLRDDDQARISLGYFTQEELSIKFVDYLQTQNIEAKSQPEYRTLGPFDWMDVEIGSDRRRVVQDRDWGDREVEVVEKDCV